MILNCTKNDTSIALICFLKTLNVKMVNNAHTLTLAKTPLKYRQDNTLAVLAASFLMLHSMYLHLVEFKFVYKTSYLHLSSVYKYMSIGRGGL